MIVLVIGWSFLMPLVLLGGLVGFPAGIVLAIVGRRKRAYFVPGLVLTLVSVVPFYFASLLALWGIDALRGWDMRLPVSIPGYEVCLIQKPGGDFYESYFEVTRSDGAKAIVLIDSDDMKWFNPDVVQKDGRFYFTRGLGRITERTSYVDPNADTIFSGYYQRFHVLSALEFR